MARIVHRKGRKNTAALITDARGSLIRNYDHRKHVYAVLQWSRIPLLLLSGAFYMWWHLPWLAAIFMVISIPMPWIAVVIANGVGEPADKRKPRVYKPAVVREQNRLWEEQMRERQLAARATLALGPADPDFVNPHHAEMPAEPSSAPQPGANESPAGDIIDMPEDLPDRD
nr:DUF3099 domain-containing protein [Corynebacterium lactis]